MRLLPLFCTLVFLAACTETNPTPVDDDGDDDSAAGDDDTGTGDDDSTAGDDDSTAGDDDTTISDDDTTPGDDDTSVGDDDTTVGDDDTTVGDDDTTVGDDDTTVGDDDTTVGDDDTTVGDDDTTVGDDDTTVGDDDSAAGDDDSALGDDDSAATPVEGDCFDALDGDADGATDCDDSECAAEPGCSACAPDFTLACGMTDSWDTTGAGATDAVDQWACSTWNESGPEYTYTFVAPYDGTVEFALSGLGGIDLDLFLSDGAQPCGPAGCLSYSNQTLTATVTEGTSYLLSVDGFLGAAGPYTLDVGCTPANEQDCGDGADEDADGDIDCDDADCATDGACQCAPAWALGCGDSDSWDTTSATATDAVDLWSCRTWDESGPEYTYSYTATADGEVTVDLSGLASGLDLDLFVGEGTEPCDGSSCLASGDNVATFDAVLGRTYTVTVDGFQGDAGAYTLDLSCATPSEVDCGDGVDGDADGVTDCADSDCTGASACLCVADAPIVCGGSDSWDTNGVGSTDVIDLWGCQTWNESGPEYTYSFVQPYDGTFTASLAGLSVDLDLFVGDGAQPCTGLNCVGSGDSTVSWTGVAGELRTITVDGYQGVSGSYTFDLDCVPAAEQDCADGADEDLDGDTDCDDSDCVGDQACLCVEDFVIGCGGSDTWNNSGAGSTDSVDQWSCVGWDESGPEYTYGFTAPYDGDVTVTISSTVDLDLFVGAGAQPCGGPNCLDYGSTTVTLAVVSGQDYTFTVDGYNGVSGGYTLDVDCLPDQEQDCQDTLDDDLDGDVDCDDSDCVGAVGCTCVDDFTLTCGGGDSWANDGVGSTDLIDGYTCVGWSETGPEYTYLFEPTTAGTATASLTNMTDDLDLFVLDAAGGCVGGACFDYGDSTTSFSFVSGDSYYIVVDGFAGSTSNFDIDLTCGP